jgi:hypothetical protein
MTLDEQRFNLKRRRHCEDIKALVIDLYIAGQGFEFEAGYYYQMNPFHNERPARVFSHTWMLGRKAAEYDLLRMRRSVKIVKREEDEEATA